MRDDYEREVPGSGRRFRGEIDRTVQRMAVTPLQFPQVFKVRPPCSREGIPYGLFFVIDGDALLVIACFHSRRDPQQWQARS
jgi:toxin ParE1/3/4